ncbi:MAG: hypothetical protein QOH76_1173 [Thermoleophilaceae bacterium]|nr:hypothetical protein [Thermoleophilaceae bacterium]
MPSRPEPRGEQQLELANAIVRIYKSHFGKGPTRARAYYHGDVITCVLRDGFTRADLTLIGAGRASAVLEQRRLLQESLREEFVAAVEQITGRKVEGFFSDSQHDPDIEVEVFVLSPGGGEAA